MNAVPPQPPQPAEPPLRWFETGPAVSAEAEPHTAQSAAQSVRRSLHPNRLHTDAPPRPPGTPPIDWFFSESSQPRQRVSHPASSPPPLSSPSSRAARPKRRSAAPSLRRRLSAFVTRMLPYGGLVALVVILCLAAATGLLSDDLENQERQMFRDVDADGDGQLGRVEIKQFIKEELGASSRFDEDDELEHAVDAVLRHALLHDDGDDGVRDDSVSREDMHVLWRRQLSGLLTARDVADWVTYALQLPQYASTFLQNDINGFDLPNLIQNDGRALSTVLHIRSPLYRSKIERAITVRLVGIASVPDPPTHVYCDDKRATWLPPGSDTGFPVHAYRVQRRGMQPPSAWQQVWNGTDTSFVDRVFVLGLYEYRVQAWNYVGGSVWSEPGVCAVLNPTPKLPFASSHADLSHPAADPSSTWVVLSTGWYFFSTLLTPIVYLGAVLVALYRCYLGNRIRTDVRTRMVDPSGLKGRPLAAGMDTLTDRFLGRIDTSHAGRPPASPEPADFTVCHFCAEPFCWYKLRKKHYCSTPGCRRVFCRLCGTVSHVGSCGTGHHCLCRDHSVSSASSLTRPPAVATAVGNGGGGGGGVAGGAGAASIVSPDSATSPAHSPRKSPVH